MHIESDENGFWLVSESATLPIADPEELYDSVKANIGPWLRERDEARYRRTAFRCMPEDIDESAGAYELSDPKHHSVHADLWDSRAGK